MATDLIVKLPNVSTQVAIRSDWIAARDKLYEEAQAACVVGVKDQTTYGIAAGLLQQITKTSNALEYMRKDISDPFNKAAKLIKGAADKAREPLEVAKKAIQKRLDDYDAAQDKIIADAKRKAEDDQRKEIERQAAEHAAAVEVGLEEAETPFVPQVAETVPAVIPQLPTSSATHRRTRIVWEIHAPDDVPREFCTIDPVKINSWLKLNEDRVAQQIDATEAKNARINGITFKLETKVISNR